MIKRFLIIFCLAGSLLSCDTLTNLPVGTGTSPVSITQAEASQGIKQALEQGIARGITTLNVEDGFFGNQAYKIFLPAEAQRVENTLRQLGMGAMVDKAIVQINRGAENAGGFARPIFTEAITEMTITDAINILRGPNDAATQYFREKTTAKLKTAFAPVIQSSLEKFSATKYYSDVVNTYNNFPTTINKINPDLQAHVVDKAVAALFDQVAKEEANIRANPVARTTEILRRVFGYAARQ